MAMNGYVAGAVILLPCRPERQLEQDLAGVPFSAGERIRMNADLAKPMLSIQVAQHLQDIRRNVNAGAHSLKRSGLFVNPYLEALALQQRGCGRASKASSDHRNAGAAFHGTAILMKTELRDDRYFWWVL
jgi:hypothetical protein